MDALRPTSDHMEMMEPPQASIITPPTGPPVARLGVRRRARPSLDAFLMDTSDPIPRGTKGHTGIESDHATPTDCSVSQLQWTKSFGPLSKAEGGPQRENVEIGASILPNKSRSSAGKRGQSLVLAPGPTILKVPPKASSTGQKRSILDHFRPPFTLQQFQCSRETIFLF